MTDRPSPHELYEQAGGDPDVYRRLMVEHGHLIPGIPQPLPCGWTPGQPVIASDKELAARVGQALTGAGHSPAGEADFGYLLRPPLEGGGHVLVFCEPSENWQKMPAGAVRTAISQYLTRYAAALTKAGYGVAPWGRGDQAEALIVAVEQAAVDKQAPDITPYLSAHNPPGGSRG